MYCFNNCYNTSEIYLYISPIKTYLHSKTIYGYFCLIIISYNNNRKFICFYCSSFSINSNNNKFNPTKNKLFIVIDARDNELISYGYKLFVIKM